MKLDMRFAVSALGLILGLAASMPLALADTAPANDNSPTKTAAHQMTKGPATNYDGFDRFRDANGNPLPGWEYLFNSPG